MKYKVEKSIWTQDDFEQMGWHDCRIHKIHLSKDLKLDIDYILKWNKPDLEGLPFTFWIVPATLVFKEIKGFEFEIDTIDLSEIEIDSIKRDIKDGKLFWTIITRIGDVEFESSGYVQFLRQEPFYKFEQSLTYNERNGYSFEQTTNQENPKRNDTHQIELEKKNQRDYENVKKRQLQRIEKEKLEKKLLNHEIKTKDYLIKKRELKDKIEFYDYWLKNTIFKGW